jgi:hypothetical protein
MLLLNLSKQVTTVSNLSIWHCQGKILSRYTSPNFKKVENLLNKISLIGIISPAIAPSHVKERVSANLAGGQNRE